MCGVLLKTGTREKCSAKMVILYYFIIYFYIYFIYNIFYIIHVGIFFVLCQTRMLLVLDYMLSSHCKANK